MYQYIRPKGYANSLDEHIIFCDYKHIASTLINLLSTDDITFTIVGCYLALVALLQRRDEIIKFFFQNLRDFKPNEYACLINGLTSFGSNPALVKFHPNLCKEILIHAGMQVFRAFCRPIGWTENDTDFIEIETNVLMKKLYHIIDTSRLKENCQELEESIGGFYYIFKMFDSKGSRYNVGYYVFEILITKGFLDIVESLFEKVRQNSQKIIPMHVKEFVDGLLDGGKRSCIVSQFKEFFEAVLFKYGSIPTVLQFCIPSTSTITKPNLIKVDDRLLTGKLSAYLESACELGLNPKLPAESRENGAYFVYCDNDYLKKQNNKIIDDFLFKYGLNQTMINSFK